MFARQARPVAYSVFVENFQGNPIDNPAAVRALLEPLLDESRHNIVVDGLPTEIYGIDTDPITGFVFSRVQGERVWQIIYTVAALAGVAVMPQDGPLCITDPAHLDRLPQDAIDEVGVRPISSGADIARVIAGIT